MDYFQFNNLPHYTQSKQFGNFLETLGWQTHILKQKERKVFVFEKRVPILGNVLKVPKALLPLPFEDLDQLGQKRKAQIVRIEPNIIVPSLIHDIQAFTSMWQRHGYGKTWKDGEIQTIRIDLRPNEEHIFKSFPRENTRRNIKSAIKNKLTAEESDDIEQFLRLHQALAHRKHFYAPPNNQVLAMWAAFRKTNNVRLLFVKNHKGEVVEGLFLVMFNGICYYRYVGTLKQAESLRAPSFAVWQAILLAKKYGCGWFDFAGITDKRNLNRRWIGFTHFKQGFSNNKIQFVLPVAQYRPPKGTLLHAIDRFF